MRLTKHICIRCIDTWCPSFPWNRDDEINWQLGIVGCPAVDPSRIRTIPVDGGCHLPEGCRYPAETLLSEDDNEG